MEQMIPFILILGLMYFLIVRPGNLERDAHDKMVASLAKDDQVVTQGGIFGKIVRVSDETVVIEIASNTRITLEKKLVARRVNDAASA